MKKFWGSVLPTTEQLQNTRLKRIVGESLLNPELWRIQRDTIALGVAAGLFWAFIPIPLQMALTAGTAIVLRCNIPVGLVMCWVTNPVTIPFFFFMNYKVGRFITFSDPIDIRAFSSTEEIFYSIGSLWLPLGAGSLVVASAASVCGYFFTKGLWRLAVMRKRAKRSRLQTDRKSGKKAAQSMNDQKSNC